MKSEFSRVVVAASIVGGVFVAAYAFVTNTPLFAIAVRLWEFLVHLF